MEELYQLTLKYKKELKELDDYVLFEGVSPNIHSGIKYLFKIDELEMAMKFVEFIYMNKKEIEETAIEELKTKLEIGKKISTVKLFF